MAREFQFYIIPTPIGNLKDITLRAIEILKKVDIIACEDSRNTQKLLNHYDIKTKTLSYHKYNEKERVSIILDLLKEGKKLALVSDAGTPLICDPGSVLIKELRANNIKITSLAGACAISTFLSQIERNTEEYSFIGFMPKSEKHIEDIYDKHKFTNMVFYDSPNRLIKTLKIIAAVNPKLKVAVGRELTKMFEEVVTDKIENVISYFDKEIKGEIIAMTYAQEIPLHELSDFSSKIDVLKSKGFKSKEIAVILSELYNLNKNEIYSYITK